MDNNSSRRPGGARTKKSTTCQLGRAGFLLITIAGTALVIGIPLEERHERSLRIRRLLDEAKALEPASTKKPLRLRSILGRDVKTFAEFRAQTVDLRVALDENDALIVKRHELLNQLTHEFADSPDALSNAAAVQPNHRGGLQASSVFRDEIACSNTLERSDETQQKNLRYSAKPRPTADGGQLHQRLTICSKKLNKEAPSCPPT